jgi:hypothetical protein
MQQIRLGGYRAAMSTDSGDTRDPLAPGGPDQGPDPFKKEFPDPAPKREGADEDERPPLGFPDPDEDAPDGDADDAPTTAGSDDSEP